ncbi:MAG: hypothetical protein ABH934_02885 [Chloroflexota bacterium]
MAKCNNCGRETLRTEDWACQWCGYPLLYGPFKKIEKTYRQLKEERLNKSIGEAGIIQETEHGLKSEKDMAPKQDLEVIKGIEMEPEPGLKKETDLILEIETDQVKEAEPEEKVEESEPESVVELEAEPAQAVEAKPEVEVEPEEEVKPEPEAEKIQETEPEEELIQESEPELEPADMELSVEEMLMAYKEDDVAADERFMNKIIRATGTVSLVDIKDKLDIHYIRLIGSGGDPWQTLQCMFGKKHSSALGELEKGQTITVQGRYKGSVIAIRMVDCVLVT